jgi:hypothetical protein
MEVVMIMMCGIEQILPQMVKNIMMDYGDERMIHHQIIDEQIKQIQQIDSDRVQ